MNEIYLTDNFKLSEFESPDTKEVKVDESLVAKLEVLRKALDDKPLVINSGYRTVEHNKEVGGSPKSQHLKGKASDIARVDGFTVDEMKDKAEAVGFDGIGTYSWGIHVDVRGYKARWDYRKE